MENNSELLLKIKDLCLTVMFNVRLAAVCLARTASSSKLLFNIIKIHYLDATSIGGLAASLLSQDGQQLRAAVENN
jgi:hypothetical protein